MCVCAPVCVLLAWTHGLVSTYREAQGERRLLSLLLVHSVTCAQQPILDFFLEAVFYISVWTTWCLSVYTCRFSWLWRKQGFHLWDGMELLHFICQCPFKNSKCCLSSHNSKWLLMLSLPDTLQVQMECSLSKNPKSEMFPNLKCPPNYNLLSINMMLKKYSLEHQEFQIFGWGMLNW